MRSEDFLEWRLFGQHKDGTVNISDGVNHALFEHVTEEQAKKLVWARKIFLGHVRGAINGKPAAE